MAQLSYDVVPSAGGFVIRLTAADGTPFPTRQAAFDAAAELARKLRFAGLSVRLRSEKQRGEPKPPAHKRSA